MRFAIWAALGSILTCGAISQAQNKTTGQAAQNKKEEGLATVRIFNPNTMAKPTAGYSHVAEVGGGKIVFIAGQVAQDRSGNLVGNGDFRAQVQQVFENLKAAGDFNSVVKLNY